MSDNKLIINTFDGGLNWDSHITNQNPTTYRYALNAIESDLYQNSFISNEHGNRLVKEYGAKITGKIYLQSRNSTLYFLQNGELHLFSHRDGSSKFVCSDKEFGCNWYLDGCEYIEPIYKYIKGCNELHVYWSSACEYRWINLDEMLSPKRKEALKSSIQAGEGCRSNPDCKEGCGNRTCDYFKLLKGASAPRVTAHAYESGGSNAFAGVYEFITRYIDEDGNTTNWFYFTQPASLGSEHNLGGEISRGHIELKLSDLDCSYSYVEIAMLRTSDNIYSAEAFKLSYSSRNASFIYTGQKGRAIDIAEILERRKRTLVKGRALYQYAGRLWLYRLKHEFNVNWQPQVDNFKVEWVAYETTAAYARENNLRGFCYGESYAFGAGLNFADYTKSDIFHIPNGGGGGETTQIPENRNQDALEQRATSNKPEEPTQDPNTESNAGSSNSANDTQAQIPTVTYTPKKYTRDRVQKPNEAGATNTDLGYEDRLKTVVDTIDAQLNALCTSDECRNCPSGTCSPNQQKVDNMLRSWEEMLSQFTEDKLNIKAPITYTVSSLREGASAIIESVKQRERIKEEAAKVTLSNSEITPGSQNLEQRSDNSGSIYDSEGRLLSNEHIKVVKSGTCAPKIERNIKYPLTKDCNGENIYSLAGQNVKHFRMPSENQVNYYKSGSRGVPSKLTPDADEHGDLTVILLGIKISNIQLPKGEDLPKELNKTNPYTIYMIERTEANKTVLAKGLALRTYLAQNQGKTHVYQRHGVNSFETVEKTIDMGGNNPRMVKNPTAHESFVLYSPDTLFKVGALGVTGFVDIGEVSGIGYRHNLYAEGIQPSNQLYGTRVDQRGTCQAVNLNVFTAGSGNYDNPTPCTGAAFVEANTVRSSPGIEMSIYPLMNRWRESCLWVGGRLPALKKGVTPDADASFVGDTLDHSVPIHNASGNIVALVRSLDDQYGDLPNASYIPILQGNGSTTISGLCGDTYTDSISIKRSGYVSDRVGNKFPIGGGSSTDGRPSNKKEDRSIKDNPEDVIKSYVGMWYSTKLPKSGDVADAKNWAGLHTTGTVDDWNTAKSKTSPDSDYYYPKVVKTLITFTCQSSVNLSKRVISDKFEEKFYPKLGSYHLGSHAPENHNWVKSYLNIFGADQNQPSVWKQNAKILIGTILGIIMPMSQVKELTDLTEVTNVAGYFISAPMLAAMWYLMKQVLFTNDWLDQMLGIPQVKTDEEGGEDDTVLSGFHDNFCSYDWSYSKMNNYSIDRGIPDPYYTCRCDDCLGGETSNEIVFSNKQILSSNIDSYRNFNGLDYLNVKADSGKLYKLFSNNNKLFAQTDDKLFIIHQNSIEPNSFQSGLYTEAYEIGENIPEGIHGTIDPKASIMTQYGFFWIDRQARKIYQFDESITEISNKGMYNFFKDHLNFCSTADCVDEKGSGVWYTMGVDPRLNRLLITKNDPSGSWTISYSLAKQKWVSFHSYTPDDYNWDRDDFYSIKGSQVWIHKNNDEGEQGDSSPCTFQNFFGEKYPHIIDFVIKDKIDQYQEPFSLNSFVLSTQSCSCSNNDLVLFSRRKTFDQIAICNSWQSGGLSNIVLKNTENMREKISQPLGCILTEYQHHGYRLNNFYDVTQDYCSPLITKETCNPQYEFTNYDFGKASMSNRVLEDNYFIVRLILNDTDDKLYTRYIMTNIEKSVR